MLREDTEDLNTKGSKKTLRFTFNGKQFDWHEQYITGAEIRALSPLDQEEEIFLAVKQPWEDELILDDTKVNLARPEIEHFYSKTKEIDISLIVNGRQKTWNKKTITYVEVVMLAFGGYNDNPNTVYTVTYDRGPNHNPEGSMVKGDQVFIKNKMIFNVTATDKS